MLKDTNGKQSSPGTLIVLCLWEIVNSLHFILIGQQNILTFNTTQRPKMTFIFLCSSYSKFFKLHMDTTKHCFTAMFILCTHILNYH